MHPFTILLYIVRGETGIVNNYIEFRNNLIQNGSRGCLHISINKFIFTRHKILLKIQLTEFASYGITLQYQDAPEITDNTISTSVAAGHWNIYLFYCSNKFKVNYNKIFFTNGYGWGLWTHYCYALSSEPSEIFNNFIFIMNSSTSGGNAVGIELNFNKYMRIYHK